MPAGLLYDLALRTARPLLRAAAPLSARLRKGVRGRADALPLLETWARCARDPDRPLVWLHAPSVGEALMTQAIVAALRMRCAEMQVVFTYFSPSAERAAARIGADVWCYLPWDVKADAHRAITALRPAVLAFVRTEIWPAHMRAAASAGARCTLLNAALAPDSSRLRFPARRLLAPAYARLDAIGAVSADDAARFARLGVPAQRVRVTGDARFDQVHARVCDIDESSPLLARLAGGPTLVAGSTWPADEAVLLPAFAALRAEGHDLRLVIAPHAPSEAHLTALERALATLDVPAARLADVEAGAPPPAAVIVDRVGVLADLYAIASMAYVGGGFGRNGLHSVVEPAAFGVPVAFGPAVGNAREALALAAQGGGEIVTDSAALTALLRRWRLENATLATAAQAAHAFVTSRLGGAAANAALVSELLG